MSNLVNVRGDAVELFKEDEGHAVLIHQVNCLGVMGSGIAAQIRKEFPDHYDDYTAEFENVRKGSMLLGSSFQTKISDDHLKKVVGVFGQEITGYDGRLYTNYSALFEGIADSLALMFQPEDTTIYIPKLIGCGLGGGNWDVVEPYLESIAERYVDYRFMIVEFDK